MHEKQRKMAGTCQSEVTIFLRGMIEKKLKEEIAAPTASNEYHH
jgi:hypothetical protein